jgi:hypothetical protein
MEGKMNDENKTKDDGWKKFIPGKGIVLDEVEISSGQGDSLIWTVKVKNITAKDFSTLKNIIGDNPSGMVPTCQK